jgi:hypothetical protein
VGKDEDSFRRSHSGQRSGFPDRNEFAVLALIFRIHTRQWPERARRNFLPITLVEWQRLDVRNALPREFGGLATKQAGRRSVGRNNQPGRRLDEKQRIRNRIEHRLVHDPKPLILTLHLIAGKGFRNVLAQQLVVPGLGQELVDGALVDGIRNRIQFGVARQNDANRIRLALFDNAKEIRAAHSGHALVGHNDTDRMFFQHRQSGLTAGCQMDDIAIPAKHAPQRLKYALFVIDKKQLPRRLLPCLIYHHNSSPIHV